MRLQEIRGFIFSAGGGMESPAECQDLPNRGLQDSRGRRRTSRAATLHN